MVRQLFRLAASQDAPSPAVESVHALAATAPPFGTVVVEDKSTYNVLVAVVVLAAIGLCSIIVLLLMLLIARRRIIVKQEAEQAQRAQAKMLKALMYGLVNVTGDPLKSQMAEFRNRREVAILITDLQDSTPQAAKNPVAFKKVIEIHNTTMREGIAKYSGYEINTEGDSFHVAFMNIADAVAFALETQYKLLEVQWPRDVLRLPSCGKVVGPHGDIVFRGPRVRMGLHWAPEGTVTNRLHMLTKHRIFVGPGFKIAQEVGDAASGGQILITHEAWGQLRQNMAGAGFPTVEQIGLFRLENSPQPTWIYQVSYQMGKPLHRKFEAPRKLVLLERGWGLNIVPPPLPRLQGGGGARGLLTFVALRIAVGEGIVVPEPAFKKLYEVVAVVAMQFRGYIFKVAEQGRFVVAFSHTVDAVRFCHAGQTSILYAHWPAAAHEVSGGQQDMPDGRPLWKGPRVAMAVHETDEYIQVTVTIPNRARHTDFYDYSGAGEQFVKHLCNVIHGGQVVLSETAWQSMQDQIPGQCQIISLGVHVIDEDFTQPILLMEAMPSLLAKRDFDPPLTLRMVEPGFRDSPDPEHNMAIAFVKVDKPDEVYEKEHADSPVSDDDIINTITAYNVAVGKYSKLLRKLLPCFGGYECKEPESGKFTLAFRQLEEAVRFCSVLQKELLHLPWPEEVLSWLACGEVHDAASGHTIWRGLRVRMGMAYGRPDYRKPLNTGRADYYGNLPNLAARVSALAQPGQVLLEGCQGFGDELQWIKEDSLALLQLGREGTLGGSSVGECIEISYLGQFLLKGLTDPKQIFQAATSTLAARRFDPPSAAIRVAPDAPKKIRLGASFASGGDSPRSLMILARLQSKRFSGFLSATLGGLGSHSSSRSSMKRGPTSDTAALRTSSSVGPRGSEASHNSTLEITRTHNSAAPGYHPSPLGAMAAAVAKQVQRQPHVRRATFGALPREESQGSVTSQDSGASYTSRAPPPLRIPLPGQGGPRSASEGEETPKSVPSRRSTAETPTAFKRLHSRMSGLSPSAAQLRDNTSDAVSLASASTSPVHPDGGGAASLVASSRSTPGSPGRALDEGGRNAQPWKLGYRASRKRSVDFDMAEQRQRQSQVMGLRGQPPSHPRPLDTGHSTSTFLVIPDSPAGELRASEALSQSPPAQAAATQYQGRQTLGQAAPGQLRSTGDSSEGGLSQALRGPQPPPGQTTLSGRLTSDSVASPRGESLQPQPPGAPRSARATIDASEQPLRSSQRGGSGRSDRSSSSQAGTPPAAGRPGLHRRSLDRSRQSSDSGSPAAAGQGARASPTAAAASRDGTSARRTSLSADPRRTSLSSSPIAVPRAGHSGASPDQSPCSLPSMLRPPPGSSPAVAGGVSVDSSFLRSRLRVNIGSPAVSALQQESAGALTPGTQYAREDAELFISDRRRSVGAVSNAAASALRSAASSAQGTPTHDLPGEQTASPSRQ